MNFLLGCTFVASLYVPGAWRAAYAEDAPEQATMASRFQFEIGQQSRALDLGFDEDDQR